MRLPTASEINPIPEDLDGKYAVKHFLGKTLEEAEGLFRENSLHYQEDLMFMGPVAFRFYVHAAINYIQSPEAIGDPDIINCFAGILKVQLGCAAEELAPVAAALASVCDYILEHYDQFDVMPEIYGDLRPRYQQLRDVFLSSSPRSDGEER